MQELLPTHQLGTYITDTCKSEGVLSVSINSTLGKHLPNTTLDDIQRQNSPSPGSHIINRRSAGKALILCNMKGRPDWKIQYEDALHILQNQLGLAVSICSYIIELYQLINISCISIIYPRFYLIFIDHSL